MSGIDYPSTVWRVSRCKKRGIEAWDGQPKSDLGDFTGVPRDEAEREAEINWQRGILLRANKSIGDAKIESWTLTEPPEPGTISAAREAGKAWLALADRLQQLADAA